MGLGNPEEYFNDIRKEADGFTERLDLKHLSLSDYIAKIRAENQNNGIFGLKTHYHQIAGFPSLPKRFPEFFPDSKYIWLSRRNLLRQAISYCRALQTSAWTHYIASAVQPIYDHEQICTCVIYFAKEIENWERFFASHRITPLHIVYEDLALDYYGTIKRVLDFLEQTGEIPPPSLEKQADEITERWVSKALEPSETGEKHLQHLSAEPLS